MSPEKRMRRVLSIQQYKEEKSLEMVSRNSISTKESVES